MCWFRGSIVHGACDLFCCELVTAAFLLFCFRMGPMRTRWHRRDGSAAELSSSFDHLLFFSFPFSFPDADIDLISNALI
jgi:hypothetical protein